VDTKDVGKGERVGFYKAGQERVGGDKEMRRVVGGGGGEKDSE